MMHIFVINIVLLVLVNFNRTVGELTVTATISDKSVVAIGFGEFVTYQFYQSIQVSCRSYPQHVDGMLELFQDDSSLKVEETPTLDQMVEISSIDLEGHSERRIMFTCQLRITIDHVSYTVENSVSLLLRAYASSISLCASSLGSSATEHESSYVVCATSLQAFQLTWSGESTLIYSDETVYIDYILSSVEILEGINPMVCSRNFRGDRIEVCRLPEFEIISEPTVSIFPESFPANVDSISFSCQSNPPSRLRWVITDDYGDILDYDLTVHFFGGGELDINIQEMAGTSNITLTGSALPSLNINTIYCISYGRQYTGIGIARKETNPDTTPSVLATSSHSTLTSSQLKRYNGFTADVTSPSSVSSAEGKSRTKESEIEDNVTVDVISPATMSSTGNEQTSQVGKNGSAIDGIKGSNDTTFIIIIIILVAGILILAVTCMVLYLRVKRSATTTNTSNEKDYKLEHTNSAYEPYQPSASAPYEEVTDARYSVPGEH